MYAYIYVCVHFDVDPYADVDRSTDSEIAGWMDRIDRSVDKKERKIDR